MKKSVHKVKTKFKMSNSEIVYQTCGCESGLKTMILGECSALNQIFLEENYLLRILNNIALEVHNLWT